MSLAGPTTLDEAFEKASRTLAQCGVVQVRNVFREDFLQELAQAVQQYRHGEYNRTSISNATLQAYPLD